MNLLLSYPLALDKPVKNSDESMEYFLDYVAKKELELYPAQEEAILELFAGRHVILNTPTGSGKSLVALALHFYSYSVSRKSVYTSPVKALVNEKFLSLCKDFGPQNVGLITGDASVNAKAPILCCTAEILAQIAMSEGARAVYHDLVMDEFHYYGDRDRGYAWQLPLLTMTQCRYLLMSATMGQTDFFAQELERWTLKKTAIVTSQIRPVPLNFSYVMTPLQETVQELITAQKAPIYIVNFTQSEATQNAQNFLSTDFCTKEEKKAIQEALKGTDFSTPFGKDMKKYLLHGIGLHHGGLLPKYRILVETLAQKGLLKLICGTDTLGVGVNIPIRTVLLTQLCKFDGKKTGILSSRDFHQIAGRAGRRGFDTKGWVVAQAPAHVIENARLEMKAKLQPKKKIVKAKPPTRGYVYFDEETFQKLIVSEPEKLTSQFQLSYALLIQVLGQSQNGCQSIKTIYKRCHESPKAKEHLLTQGMVLFKSLLQKNIIQWIPKDEQVHTPIRVNEDFQKDFSLHETLSLFLLESLVHLDPMAEDYPLALLSFTESILDNPQFILKKQEDAQKKAKLVEMKLSGLEYEERIEELQKITYPKPMAEYIYHMFDQYNAKHPWLDKEHIRPKSIARDMYEQFHEFNEYVRLYGLERGEGLLLRYLSSVYKLLSQTVPDHMKNDAIDDMIVYFHQMIKDVDESIFEEWRKLQDPSFVQEKNIPESVELKPLAQDTKKLTHLIRHKIYQWVRALAKKDWEAMTRMMDPDGLPDMEKLSQWLQSYEEENGLIRFDPKTRYPHYTHLSEEIKGETWFVEQTLCDEKGHDDTTLCFRVSLKNKENGKDQDVVLILLDK